MERSITRSEFTQDWEATQQSALKKAARTQDQTALSEWLDARPTCKEFVSLCTNVLRQRTYKTPDGCANDSWRTLPCLHPPCSHTLTKDHLGPTLSQRCVRRIRCTSGRATHSQRRWPIQV